MVNVLALIQQSKLANKIPYEDMKDPETAVAIWHHMDMLQNDNKHKDEMLNMVRTHSTEQGSHLSSSTSALACLTELMKEEKKESKRTGDTLAASEKNNMELKQENEKYVKELDEAIRCIAQLEPAKIRLEKMKNNDAKEKVKVNDKKYLKKIVPVGVGKTKNSYISCVVVRKEEIIRTKYTIQVKEDGQMKEYDVSEGLLVDKPDEKSAYQIDGLMPEVWKRRRMQ